jgi:glycosyltransferase involved in cell wall biosynthesis
MRILHLWDQAGVAFVLAKYQRLRGYDSKTIMVREFDKYGIGKFYNEYIDDTTREEFVQRSLKEARYADVLHVHSRSDMVVKLRKYFGNSKKIILQYHGSDIRGIKKQKLPHRSKISDLAIRGIFAYRRMRDKIRRIQLNAQRMADAVIVSTPDLLPLVSNAIYIPNPVDIDHFTPHVIRKENKKNAIAFKTEVTDAQWLLYYCKYNNIRLDIEVYDRSKTPIMHADMPEFLRQYAVYVDIKYVEEQLLQALSKTALEALACGLTVLDFKLDCRQGLPDEYTPMNVVSRLETIYS